MKLKAVLIGLLLAGASHAQKEVNEDFANQMNSLFSPLQKERIPHNLLLDYGMEFTNVPAFNGSLSPASYVDASILKQIYNTLLTSRVTDNGSASGFVLPEEMDTRWYNDRYASPGRIALCGLFFKYSQFKTDALQNGLVTFTNNKFYDAFVNGAWQNPYQEANAFAMAPAVQWYKGLSFNVNISSASFYSNYKNLIQSLQIDFGNGQGFKTIGFDQPLNVSYTKAGTYDWNYKLILSSGEVLLSHSRIKIETALKTLPYGGMAFARPQGTSSVLYSKEIVSDLLYNQKRGVARLTIDLAKGNTRIKKPLIVAEGFDMGSLLEPEKPEGIAGYQDFKENILGSGNELRNLIDGTSKQYDIIYIDWGNGVDYLQRNAYALESVIKWVNEEKLAAGSIEKNVVLGQSMGGVLARYALRDMEERGLNHDTRLFISHDSPQQGANIPVGLQYLYRNALNQFVRTNISLGGVYANIQLLPHKGIKQVDGYLNLLDAPAARQMLGNFVTTNYNIDNTVHDVFYNELRAKGYPRLTRNLSISNGSECGATQGFNPGDELIRYKSDKGLGFLGELVSLAINPLAGLFGAAHIDINFLGLAVWGMVPGKSTYHIDCSVKAIPYGSGQEIYKLYLTYTKKIFWVVNITTTLKNVSHAQPDGVLPLDIYGGGFISTGNYGGTAALGDIFIRDKFGFIPTPSSLDIGSGNISIEDRDYRSAYIGAFPPAYPKNTLFHNFTTGFNVFNNIKNQQHISFNDRNGNWLAKELTKVPSFSNCSFACDGSQVITGDANMCTAPTGYAAPGGAAFYNWSITSGGSLASITSGNGTSNITLTPAANANGSLTLKVVYGNAQECGVYTLVKTIKIGRPDFMIQQMTQVNEFSAKAVVTGRYTPLIDQGITAVNYNILSSSENAHVSFYNYTNEYVFEGNGKTNTWSKDILLTVQNSCGSTQQEFRLIPPLLLKPAMKGRFETITNNSYRIQLDNEEAQKKDFLKNYGIKVYDLYNVERKTTTENQIDLSDLPTGFYILRTTVEQTPLSLKVFKQ